MMKRLAFILAAAGAALSFAYAGIGDWKNFTAMNAVRATASSHDSIWAATSGGVFLYTLSDSSFTRFTNSEGLTTNDVTAIAIDRTGSVWFGQANGSIDVYTPSTGKWRYVRDIAVASKSQKSIMTFFVSGDSLYIGTSFGISLFSIRRFEFIDTYSNFGADVIPPVVAVRSFNNRIYAATAKGIVVSEPSAVNLAAPESWKPYTAPGSVSSLAVFNQTVVAAGANGLFTFDGASTWSRVPSVSQSVIIAAESATKLFLAHNNEVSSFTADGTASGIGSALGSPVTGGTVANGTLVLATAANGIAFERPPSGGWTAAMPDGPGSNSFVSLAVDADGVIWAASGSQYGAGFYSYNGSRWRTYSTANTPAMKTNDCFGVAIGPDNSKWISTWGGGLVRLDAQGTLARVFDGTNPGFVGIPENKEYIVTAVPSFDDRGNVWTACYRSTDLAKITWKMNTDNTWESFGAAGGYVYILGVLVDRNNTKWFTNAIAGHVPLAEPRLVFLNEQNKAIAGSSDGWGELTEANGLTSRFVTSAVEDREGALWLGTSIGISVINDPLRPGTVSKVFLGAVRDQFINCISVDAVNNKWIGTSRGVFVLSPDGTSLLEQYTVDNSNGKLVDDNVLSIAFDMKQGVAYFGTAKGLSSVGIATVAASADYGQMSVAPNPFRSWIDESVTIQGLAEGSTIKILTATGKLVKQFSAQGGGRAFWNGKTESGEPAASGIYIAVAYSENGSRIGTVKLAVIRR